MTLELVPQALSGEISPKGRSLAVIEAAIEAELARVKRSSARMHELLREARPLFETGAEHKAWAMRRFGWGLTRYAQLMRPAADEAARLGHQKMVRELDKHVRVQFTRKPTGAPTVKKPIGVRELDSKLREVSRISAGHTAYLLGDLFFKGEQHEHGGRVHMTWSQEDFLSLVETIEGFKKLWDQAQA
jgi:hypothetical protein